MLMIKHVDPDIYISQTKIYIHFYM